MQAQKSDTGEIFHLSRNLRVLGRDEAGVDARAWAKTILSIGDGTAETVNDDGDVPWVKYDPDMSMHSEAQLLS